MSYLVKFSVLMVALPLLTWAQSVEDLLELIESGQIDSARQLITELSYSNPGNPGVRYARALVEPDALVAAGIYKDIIRNHPESAYIPGSLMRLGEFYFAQGLYIQSRNHFGELIRKYEDFPEIVNAGNLLLRAGVASRQMDKAYDDLAELINRYPTKSFDIPDDLDVTRVRGSSVISYPEVEPQQSASLRKLGAEIATDQSTSAAEFSLQAGAFGNYENARRLADQIEAVGYTTTLKERVVNNKTLYLIWVGEYSTRTAAESAADMLEAALGIDSFPVSLY